MQWEEDNNLGLGGLSISQERSMDSVVNVVIQIMFGSFFYIFAFLSTTSFPQLIKEWKSWAPQKFYHAHLLHVPLFLYPHWWDVSNEKGEDSRCFGGRWFWQTKVIGHMIGNAFLGEVFTAGKGFIWAMLPRVSRNHAWDHGSRFGLAEILFLFLSPFLFFLRIYLVWHQSSDWELIILSYDYPTGRLP